MSLGFASLAELPLSTQPATASGVTGTSATTNANDTSSASGTTTIVGTSASTNANDTSSASGTTTVLGASSTTNANDVSAASGTTTIVCVGATTNANDTSDASGTVGSAVVDVPVALTGAPGRMYQSGYMAEVNGVLRHFATLEDLREFLASFTKKQKQKLRKRTTVTKVEIPRIEIPAQTAQPAVQLIQRANASMEVYYWQQYELLIQAQDEDDEESIIALFG